MSEIRQAVRVILVDGQGRTLLFHSVDDYWFTPGGGLEEGEDLQSAARREVWEEVGLELGELGKPLASEQIEFDFEGQHIVQFQTYFLVRLDSEHQVSRTGWTELEVRAVRDCRWWSCEEIAASAERIYPERLVDWLKKA